MTPGPNCSGAFRPVGAATCRELTGCDITTAEGYAAYAAAGGNQRCGDYVELAARTVADLLGD